ncbi:MAG TPA: hypothetical protein VM577_09300 [Anaerovoracaceae bacterium]|nr:hypothetical protein [Anaerovoracaceae bacterium]
MFLFWNSVRIFTYVPTIMKLLKKDADVRSYSLATWGSWVLSNLTFALMLLENNHGVPDKMFLINMGNTVMCLATSLIIMRLKCKVKKEASTQETILPTLQS